MSIQRVRNSRLWLAIARVQPQIPEDVLVGATGAHVVVFGLAEEENSFLEAATRLLIALEFNVIEIDEIEQVALSEFKKRATAEMYSVAKTLSEDTPVGYGTFYTYNE